MSHPRQVAKSQVMSGLDAQTADPVLRECIEALHLDERTFFTTTDSPAELLRESLEIKYQIARQHGKTVRGDADFLLRLQELGESTSGQGEGEASVQPDRYRPRMIPVNRCHPEGARLRPQTSPTNTDFVVGRRCARCAT